MFSSPVDVAVDLEALAPGDSEFSVYLTPRGRQTADWQFLMTLLGGMIESWGAEEDYMKEDFERQLHRYYVELGGPSEWLRDHIAAELEPLGETWKRVNCTRDGGLVVEYNDGRVVEVPAKSGGTGRHK